MAHLLLRGVPLGPPTGGIFRIDAVLFDKDGTLSHSEAMLQALATARVEGCLALAGLEAASWQGGSLETALVHALVVLLFSLAFLLLAFFGFQRSQKRMDLKGGTT